MQYRALATDFDGTLATDGSVDTSTLDGLRRLRESGRKLILITGRELEELQAVFARIELVDLVVAENGALLYDPSTEQATLLGKPLPDEFVETLTRRGVRPLSVGRVIVATRVPHESVVSEVIRGLSLDAVVIFNKGAVMALPSGINKATGLRAALGRLGLPPENVAGIGDAENDQAFLELCRCSAAVANALPQLKQTVDYVCQRSHGAGVTELIDRLVDGDVNGR